MESEIGTKLLVWPSFLASNRHPNFRGKRDKRAESHLANHKDENFRLDNPSNQNQIKVRRSSSKSNYPLKSSQLVPNNLAQRRAIEGQHWPRTNKMRRLVASKEKLFASSEIRLCNSSYKILLLALSLLLATLMRQNLALKLEAQPTANSNLTAPQNSQIEQQLTGKFCANCATSYT